MGGGVSVVKKANARSTHSAKRTKTRLSDFLFCFVSVFWGERGLAWSGFALCCYRCCLFVAVVAAAAVAGGGGGAAAAVEVVY